MNSQKNLWIFLLALSGLRLLAAVNFGQTVDEAHYVLYGRLLDWSYFDHPPLVGWVHAVFQYMPINHLLQARVPSVLISLWTSKLVFDYLSQKNVSLQNNIFSVGVLNLTPMYNTMSIALLPDTLLMPLTFLILKYTEKVLIHSTFKNWARLGLFLGLAGLSKYTAILYVIALLLIFVYRKKWNELLKPQIWVGILIAGILVLPVLYWNLQNNFVSFKYQADHVSSGGSSVLQNMLNSFGIQMFSWGFGAFIAALAVHALLLSKFRQLLSHAQALVFLSVFLLFFIYVSVSEVLLPHWMLIYFIVAVPIAFSHLLERRIAVRWVYSAAALSSALGLVLLLETAFKIFPTDKTSGLYEGVTGWSELVGEAEQKLSLLQNPKRALAVMNWTLGSRSLYYTKQSKVFVIDQRFDQFDIWNPESPLGYDLVVMIEAQKKDEHLAHLDCGEISPIGEKITKIKDVPVNHFLYYYCANFLAYK